MYSNGITRSIGRFTPIAGIFVKEQHKHDVDLLGQPPPETPETGWDRVKKMYTKDQYDTVSLEINNVLQSTMTGTFIGACIGGFVFSKSAYINFIHNNQATTFKTTADAKKKLQDYVTVSFAKGAVKWGWRLGIFTGIFSLTATTISVYRDSTSVVEYVAAGAMAGGLYKIQMGMAAAFVGAGLGATLGGIAGVLIVSLLKITGLCMDDIRKALNNLNERRVDQYNQAIDKQSIIKTDPLAKNHDLLIKEQGQLALEDVQ